MFSLFIVNIPQLKPSPIIKLILSEARTSSNIVESISINTEYTYGAYNSVGISVIFGHGGPVVK